MEEKNNEELKDVKVEETFKENDKIESSGKPKISGFTAALLVLLALSLGLFALNYDRVIYYFKDDKPKEKIEKIEVNLESFKNDYTITKNSLDNFDLAFLKLENEKKNMIYSPLSIKYALGMLMTGAEGDSKTQINTLLGKYRFHKFSNNENMSFANALFVKNTYKDSIKKSFVDSLTKNFNADVRYDSFSSSDAINKYISDKTFNLINGVVDDIKDNDYILLNALAIDMNWVHRIQYDEGEDDDKLFKNDKMYNVYFNHLDYSDSIGPLNETDYHKLSFNSDGMSRQSVEIGAVINNYDIVKLLGKDTIKKTVMDDYNKWVKKGASNACEICDYDDDENGDCKKDTSFDIDNYIKELDSNYGKASSSTDFEFYVDDNVKVFKKDLRKYYNTTLEYVAIMPLKNSLQKYINEVKEDEINNLISSTKKIESKNFKEGVITEIHGYIPLFDFDYELNLKDDLNKLGIVDIFDIEKANLSSLTTSKSVINDAIHKAKIEFTNEGIKAAAYTMMSGRGAGDCGYDYLFIPPVEKIDLTFDKPFLFLIIDKDTKEVWFMGRVYEPSKYKSYTSTLEELHPEYFNEDEDEDVDFDYDNELEYEDE